MLVRSSLVSYLISAPYIEHLLNAAKTTYIDKIYRLSGPKVTLNLLEGLVSPLNNNKHD
jgi:hypothetical protein